MDNRDKLLNAMLDGYSVKDVEPEFLQQIMAQVKQQPPQKNNIVFLFFQQAIAIAACAAFGFWMGNVDMQPQEDAQLESLIFGSTQLEEILL